MRIESGFQSGIQIKDKVRDYRIDVPVMRSGSDMMMSPMSSEALINPVFIEIYVHSQFDIVA